MNSCGAVFVLNVHVGVRFLAQKTQHGVVAVSSGEVKSCKLVFSFHVHPTLHFLNLTYAKVLFIETIFPSILK